MLLEALALDVADVRLSLARGLHFPAEHGGIACLSLMLDFIEHGTYPPWWEGAFVDTELRQREKTFDICKAAMVKAVVEVAGEEKNEDVLWDDSETDKPGGVLVFKMVEWLKAYAVAAGNEGINGKQPEGSITANRDDLAICASLALGNLSRRGQCHQESFRTGCLSANHQRNMRLFYLQHRTTWHQFLHHLLCCRCRPISK